MPPQLKMQSPCGQSWPLHMRLSLRPARRRRWCLRNPRLFVRRWVRPAPSCCRRESWRLLPERKWGTCGLSWRWSAQTSLMPGGRGLFCRREPWWSSRLPGSLSSERAWSGSAQPSALRASGRRPPAPRVWALARPLPVLPLLLGWLVGPLLLPPQQRTIHKACRWPCGEGPSGRVALMARRRGRTGARRRSGRRRRRKKRRRRQRRAGKGEPRGPSARRRTRR
mmetsp:Transcript_63719/g.176725  ORF Transcript_63719/g.176725 Transcript_63719/m.176725 type:complete len:224 (+) Transcript_63719:885-1556(+)